ATTTVTPPGGREARKAPHPGKRAGDRQRPGPPRHEEAGAADPDEKHDHHRAPAPEITEAAGGQRANPEQHERTNRVGHEVLPCHAPLGGDRRHGRREDQQEEGVESMTDVQQHARRARVLHVPKPTAGPGCLACYTRPKIVEKRTWRQPLARAALGPLIPPTISGCLGRWPRWPRISQTAITTIPTSTSARS